MGAKEIPAESLGDYLKGRLEADPTAKFALKSSKKAPFEVIVKVMDAVKIAGIDQLPTFTADVAGPSPAETAPAPAPASSPIPSTAPDVPSLPSSP